VHSAQGREPQLAIVPHWSEAERGLTMVSQSAREPVADRATLTLRQRRYLAEQWLAPPLLRTLVAARPVELQPALFPRSAIWPRRWMAVHWFRNRTPRRRMRAPG
jgi:hypothetical protein